MIILTGRVKFSPSLFLFKDYKMNENEYYDWLSELAGTQETPEDYKV
jgi:hypothetical protein